MVAGDTLLGIAAKLDVTADELATANSISDPTTIQIGQKLLIPAKKQSPASAATPAAATAPVPAPATPSPTPASKEPLKHVVKPGETLIQIANSYGFTSGDLARFNGLSNTDQLRVGQELLIPPS
ncbi:MAG: LysM peptidoglycan-binding domain-containing protein [Chloroflexi bacterium]|nr:LysM peptidoglycan-binding domain-containing protein [Chloroflexota bacterium]